jgi:photosystem II stability/assembly factor-like uncharacterized protein
MSLSKRLLSFVLIAVLLAAAFPFISMPTPAAAANEWTIMNSGTSTRLMDVWCHTSNDVFAVGFDGLILHYDGSTWTTMTSGTPVILYKVWGTSSTNVYAVGNEGTILHYNGSSWAFMDSPSAEISLRGIWGTSATNIYVVGNDGLILHYDGVSWTNVSPSGVSENLHAVMGSSADNIYVVGGDGAVLRWNGSGWFNYTGIFTTRELYSIWVNSANDIYIGGQYGTLLHYDGSSWTLIDTGAITSFWGLWGSSASNVFAVGDFQVPGSASIYNYNGSTWVPMPVGVSAYPPYGLTNDVAGISGNCASDVFAVGSSGLILHYGSSSCTGPVTGPSRATVSTTLGEVAFTTDAGLIGNLLNVKVANTTCATPAGYDFPYGLFSFKITGLTAGQTVRTTIKFPRRLPNNVKYYKCINNRMVDCTSLITRLDDYTLVLSITDGKLGDSDNSANGTIVDPGGPVESVTTAQVYGQGTMPAATQQAPVALSSISVKSASLSATRVGPGEAVTVIANVANTGTGNGTSSIKVYINGEMENSQGVTVSSGSSTPVTFTVSRNEPGTYSVYVGGTNAGSFTVDQFTPQTILIISGALVFFAFVLGIIYTTRRKTQG